MSDIFELFKKISVGSDVSSAPIEYIIVGLGNPGKQYELTRHNAGFIMIDALATHFSATVNRAKYKALVGEAFISGKRVLLMKPQTFMNLSGEAVSAAMNFYKLDASRLIVISDDISLDVGKMRVRRKGSAGGHNGLKSINECIGSENYVRLKMGVGKKPHPEYDLAAWVLSNFDAEEQKALMGLSDSVCIGIEKILNGDIDGAMQLCNSK